MHMPSLRIALTRPQGAPQRLQRRGADAPAAHALAQVMQPRKRLVGVTAASTPEDFGHGGGAGPEERFDVGLISLLGPQENLACMGDFRLRETHSAGMGRAHRRGRGGVDRAG